MNAMKGTTRHLVDEGSESLINLPSGRLSLENLKFARSVPPLGLSPPECPESLICRTERARRADYEAVEVLILEQEQSRQAHTNRSAILFVHGGGMITGNANDVLYELPSVVEKYNCLVASVEYRLAPEAPFPQPQEDVYTAYTWLVDNAQSLGIDADNISVMGISAGGGLAASLTHMLRDRGAKQCAAQVLVYPMLDARTGTSTAPVQNRSTGEYVWGHENNQFGWECLRGNYEPVDERKGWYSPALAEDFSDLPPAFIGTGALDLFVDENMEYARRLIDAGVAAELHVYPGAVHGFNVIKNTGLADQFDTDIDRFFQKLFL
jgi:acetyl esterase/lipase